MLLDSIKKSDLTLNYLKSKNELNRKNLKVYKDLWKTITSGKVWENDIQDLTKSGKPFWLHLVISPEFNQQNEIEGYTAIAQDITDKKNY